MGWKGTVRSINAACRAAERESQRRQRADEKRQRQYEKMQALASAEYEVEQHNDKILQLKSLHKECSLPVDWVAMINEPEPETPSKKSIHEQKATTAALTYKPSWLDKIFKLEDKKRKKLSDAITTAITADENDYRTSLKNWADEHEKWTDNVRIAQGVLNDNPDIKAEAIEQFNTFTDLMDIGSAVSFNIEKGKILEVELNVKGKDIVPAEVKSLLKSGRVTVKKMQQGEFNELYQDYVCSAVLRVANETFSLLPDEFVLITATDKLLNSRTGHLEDMPIVSVVISRSTLNTLNLDRIDPSDSMSNFIHKMDFKKNKGFEPVERLKQEDISYLM